MSIGFVLIVVLGVCSGCYTMGRDFQGTKIQAVEKGVTTKSDVLNQFGAPHSKGIENGMETWTYSYYKFRLIGMETWAKDFTVGFDKKGVVQTYSYSSSFPPSY